MATSFRRLEDSELDEAHAIVAAATEWLNNRGIVQWTRVMPREMYMERQERGENYGLFEPGLSAVMTLKEQAPEYWRDREYEKPFLWLSTLASRRDVPGSGGRALEAAVDFTARSGFASLYLDCVDRDDALPSFYRRAGFEQLERREVWPGWPMCLFVKRFDGEQA